jgi:hypothetical protein
MDLEGGYAFCPTEKSLIQFAIDGLWKSLHDLELEIGIDRSELIGKWFLIIHGRCFMK